MLDKVGEKSVSVVEEEPHGKQTALSDELTVSKPVKPRQSVAGFIGKFLLSILQIILMIAVLMAAFSMTKRMIEEKPETKKRRAFKSVYTVDTIVAKAQDYQPVFTSYGQTVAARSVDLRALVSGEIVKVNPKLRSGAPVEKGESLVTIDEFNYRGALAEAEANLLEARARVVENEAQISLEKRKLESAKEQLGFAVADLKRIERLAKSKTSTQQQVEARKLVVSQRSQAVDLSQDTIKVQEARLGQLKASIERLEWRVDQAMRNLKSTVLTAPFSGIIRSSSAEIGRAITANDVVVSMYQADRLEVKFTLTDAQYGRLQNDQAGLIDRPVEVVWSVGGKDWTYSAQIDRLGAEIASSRGGVELFAVVDNGQNSIPIRPGAFVEVRVPDRSFTDAILVPDTSLYGTDTVYTVVEEKLVENTVVVSAFDGEQVLVTSGLNDGDEVLSTRITEVSAGLNVRKADATEPKVAVTKPTDKPESTARTGRPDREEIQAILKKNNLTIEAFRALDNEKKRELIRNHRAAQ